MAIQFRRGNETDLVSEQLLPGEPAYAIDTKRLVIGDGEGDATLIPTDEEVRNQVDDIVNSRFASKMNLGTTLYHNPNGLQITAGMNIPLLDDTSKYTHLLFDMYAGEGTGTGKRPHITEASGEIVFTATNLVNAPSSSTYYAIFEAVLQVSTNSISVTGFRRVAVSGGSTYTPSYDENVIAASWTIYRIIGLQFYADVDGGPAETYLSQLIAQTQAARDSANTAAGEVRSEMAGIKAVDGIVKGDGAGNFSAADAGDMPITDEDEHFTAGTVEGALAELAEGKVNTDGDKVLSDNNYTDADKAKVDNLPDDTNTALTETNLRIATINKSLSDYQNAIASINVNQSPKQTASGYGTVSLPVNAANGQVSVSVKGNTYTQILEINKRDWRNSFTAYGDSEITQNSAIIRGLYSHRIELSNPIEYREGKKYGMLIGAYPDDTTVWYRGTDKGYKVSKGYAKTIFDYNDLSPILEERQIFWSGGATTIWITKLIIVELDAQSEWDFTNLSSEELSQKYHCIFGTNSTISAGRLVSENEDETERTEMYIPDVGVLRSVGDVRDEIVGGEHIKRIDDDGETVLVEPIVTPIDVTGTLIGHPNGTIYWEPVLPVAGVYTAEGISVTNEDFAIDTLERIAKIDFMTGVETEVDVSQAVIAGDGLSFTHAELADGDIVFFTYYHAVEGTQPEIDVEYYDSRYTVKDSETEQFYAWKVTVTNGTPTLEIVEV